MLHDINSINDISYRDYTCWLRAYVHIDASLISPTVQSISEFSDPWTTSDVIDAQDTKSLTSTAAGQGRRFSVSSAVAR